MLNPPAVYQTKYKICNKMAAEWDNLIPDPRDMRAKNGSFEDELEGIV